MMKKFFRTLAFVAVAAVSAVSVSCQKDDDDDNNNKMGVFNLDPNRASGGAVDQMSGVSSQAFYNGLTNNPAESSIVVDTRSASMYNAGHVKTAISIPVEDDAFYYDDDLIYTKLESLDPTHSKYILLTDLGASQLMIHVAGRLSAMGWGKERVYLLMDNTSDFLKKYPELKEK